MATPLEAAVAQTLQRGAVIPACPLALNADRRLDERRQRALVRYYRDAGAGGLAVGVHTTQFAIRDPRHGLLRPVLELVAEEFKRLGPPMVHIAGICGPTAQALDEALLARDLGYQVGLLSLGALKDDTEDRLLAHCRAVAEVIPVMGFYLQPAAGGRVLSYSFWRRFTEIERVVAIKIAPFNRYQTLDVVRAVAESGRNSIALYTGNDDNIIPDLVTAYRFGTTERRMVGGLLGQWAVWTRKAAELLQECHGGARQRGDVPVELLRRHVELTDANAAIFDAAHTFSGCIPGIHEVLRRQGLLEGTWCLDPGETLSPGQAAEIDRVYGAYPHLADDDFVHDNLERWLSG